MSALMLFAAIVITLMSGIVVGGDPAQAVAAGSSCGYHHHCPTPSPRPSASPCPTLTPTPTSTPKPTSTATSTTTVSPTVSVSSPPTLPRTGSAPGPYIAAGVLVIAAGVALIVLGKRRRTAVVP